MRGDRDQHDNILDDRQHDLPIVKIRVQRYANYDHWMTGELVKLVERWAHLAGPSATRAGIGTGNRMGRIVI